jgi:TP901 family phage tail tape measure protein
MANENIVTNIVASSDFSNLIADVYKVTNALSQMQEQTANLNRTMQGQIGKMHQTFSDTIKSTGQFSTHFVSLSSDAEKFGKSLDSGKLKLKDYYKTWNEHHRTSTGLVRDLAKQQVTLQNAVFQSLGKNAQGLQQFNVHIPRGLDEIKNKSAIARQELQIMNKVVQEGANQLINWGKNTQWAGRQLTVGLTVPIAAFGKAAADAFRQADQELVRLTKVYGDIAGTSSEELGRVRKDVVETSRDIANAYGVSFKETIGLAADIAATGKTGNELLKSVQETTRLAVLGEVDRQEAMKATLAIQTAFKQSSDELANSINFLNSVENQTSTTLADLVEAIPKAGTVIQGMGGSVKDLALYLTAMKEGGVNASEGANAIKSSLASLINPTKVAREMFSGFGIDLERIVSGNAGNVTQTILDLQSALNTLDPLSKQKALEQLFGKFQFARMNALFSNLGQQGSQTLKVMELMKASSEDLASVASRELAQVTESASGKYRRALEGLKADLATIGEAFLNINTKLINFIDGIIDFANKLPKPLKNVLAVLGGITAAAGPLIMLTGVLANFFGYVVKGLYHMKAFFKGGEGWKYLTPEILAADKAGVLIEKTFYSDAQAATVLRQALRELNEEFAVLQANAKSGQTSAKPVIATLASNPVVMVGGGRTVDPNHPLVGPAYSRESAHMNPRGLMTPEQRASQTFLGMVPSSGPVNRVIGQNPMIYAENNLPNIPGLTSFSNNRGTSSAGIVAGEAAKWYAMMGALAMQSKAEIEVLKKQIATTGVITREVMNSFDDILPAMTRLTSDAAAQSAAIVAELQAGKITIDAARQRIMALNFQVEAQMGAAITGVAASQGRSVDLSKIPTLGQPVVNARGSSNMRELFKKSSTAELIDKVARGLGVRTSGAGYNIETTRPKRMANGGPVYLNNGSDRYRPSVSRQVNRLVAERTLAEAKPSGTDIVPAMLTPGEYVVRASSVTPETLPLLEALNKGGPEHLSSQMLWQSTALNQGIEGSGVGGNDPMVLSGRNIASDYRGLRAAGLPPVSLLYHTGKELGYDSNKLRFHLNNYEKALAQKLASYGNRVLSKKELELIQENLLKRHAAQLFRVDPSTGAKINFFQETALMGSRRVGGKGGTGFIGGIIRALLGTSSGFSKGQNETHLGIAQELLDDPVYSVDKDAGTMTHIPSGTVTNPRSDRMTLSKMFGAQKGHLGSRVWGSVSAIISKLAQVRRGVPLKMSAGGMVPGYSMGGMIPSQNEQKYSMGGIVQGYNEGGQIPYMPGYSPSGPMLADQMGLSSNMSYSDTPTGRSMRGYGMMSGMVGSIGGYAAGSAIGGPAGGMVGSIVGPMAMPMLMQATSKLKVLTTVAQGAAKGAGLLKNAFMLMPPQIKVAMVAAGLLTVGFNKLRDQMEKTAATNRLAWGGAAGPITDFGKKIEEARKKVLAAKEANDLYLATRTDAGVPGIKLTVQEMQNLKKEVTATYPELIKLFNQTPDTKLNDVVAGLKAQFIAAGDSANEATKKIAGLLAATGKSDSIKDVLTSTNVKKIKDDASAISSLLDSLSDPNKAGSTKDFAAILGTTIDGMDKSAERLSTIKNELTGKTLTAEEAVKKQFDAIGNSSSKNLKISRDQIKEIAKQDEQLAALLEKGDSIRAVFAKWRISLSGVNRDLSDLSDNQLEKLAVYMAGVTNYVSALNDTTSATAKSGPFGALVAEVNSFEEGQKKTLKNAQALTTSINDQIKAKQKQIDLIKKEADARKKAIQDQLQSEDLKLQIQQEQLKYQDALASGDMSAAANAQLAIQRLVGQQQAGLAEKAIDDSAQAKIDKLTAQIEKLQNAGDKVSGATSGTSPKNVAGSKMKEINSQLNALVGEIAMQEGGVATKDQINIFANLMKDLRAIGTPEAKSAASKINPSGTGITSPKAAFSSGAYKDLMGYYDGNNEKVSGIMDTVQNTIAKNTGISAEYAKKLYELAAPEEKKKTPPVTTPYTTGRGGGVVGYRGTVPRRARGGDVSAGRMYLVGEEGPELAYFGASGYIISNNQINSPRFKVPNRGYSMSVNTGAGNISNVTYQTTIELNGTNVTMDDAIRKFEAHIRKRESKVGGGKLIV